MVHLTPKFVKLEKEFLIPLFILCIQVNCNTCDDFFSGYNYITVALTMDLIVIVFNQ